MKENLHPTWYPEARVVCACGNTWTTGATIAEVRTDICSACHPFYTGEQRIVDTEGQVDRFMKRLQVRDNIRAEQEEREAAKQPENLALTDLGLDKRLTNVLAENGIETAGQFLERLEEGGDEAFLSISGIGRQYLATIKKGLRARGFDVPKAAEAAE